MSNNEAAEQAVADLKKLLEDHDVELYTTKRGKRILYTVCAWKGENSIVERTRGDLPAALRRLASSLEPGRG